MLSEPRLHFLARRCSPSPNPTAGERGRRRANVHFSPFSFLTLWHKSSGRTTPQYEMLYTDRRGWAGGKLLEAFIKKLFTLNSFTVKLVTSSPESEAVDVGNFQQQMLKHQKEKHESTQ